MADITGRLNVANADHKPVQHELVLFAGNKATRLIETTLELLEPS